MAVSPNHPPAATPAPSATSGPRGRAIGPTAPARTNPTTSFGAIRKALAGTPEPARRRETARPPPDDERLDPCARLLHGLAPPSAAAPAAPEPPPAAPSPSPSPSPSPASSPAPAALGGGTTPRLVDALERAQDLVDRVALWTDGTAGLARLRFDARARGGLGAATVTVEHRDGVLCVAGDGVDEATLAALRERLRARGLVVDD